MFWTVLRAKLMLFVLFFVSFVALAGAQPGDRRPAGADPRSRPTSIPYVERFHEFFGRRLRLFRYGVAVLLGLLFAAPAIGQWQEWLMFRNASAFGIADAQFRHDVGFYVFRLPFIALRARLAVRRA